MMKWTERRKSYWKDTKNIPAINVMVMGGLPADVMRKMQYTGAGEDGKVQPSMPVEMVQTMGGPRMIHEGEAKVQRPDGSVQVISQPQLHQMEHQTGMPGYQEGGSFYDPTKTSAPVNATQRMPGEQQWNSQEQQNQFQNYINNYSKPSTGLTTNFPVPTNIDPKLEYSLLHQDSVTPPRSGVTVDPNLMQGGPSTTTGVPSATPVKIAPNLMQGGPVAATSMPNNPANTMVRPAETPQADLYGKNALNLYNASTAGQSFVDAQKMAANPNMTPGAKAATQAESQMRADAGMSELAYNLEQKKMDELRTTFDKAEAIGDTAAMQSAWAAMHPGETLDLSNYMTKYTNEAETDLSGAISAMSADPDWKWQSDAGTTAKGKRLFKMYTGIDPESDPFAFQTFMDSQVSSNKAATNSIDVQINTIKGSDWYKALPKDTASAPTGYTGMTQDDVSNVFSILAIGGSWSSSAGGFVDPTGNVISGPNSGKTLEETNATSVVDSKTILKTFAPYLTGEKNVNGILAMNLGSYSKDQNTKTLVDSLHQYSPSKSAPIKSTYFYVLGKDGEKIPYYRPDTEDNTALNLVSGNTETFVNSTSEGGWYLPSQFTMDREGYLAIKTSPLTEGDPRKTIIMSQAPTYTPSTIGPTPGTFFIVVDANGNKIPYFRETAANNAVNLLTSKIENFIKDSKGNWILSG